jgi:hypothetical protein
LDWGLDYESQGVSVNRLRQYVDRWCCWLWGGLDGRVTHQGGVEKYWPWLQIQTTLNSKKNQALSLTGKVRCKLRTVREGMGKQFSISASTPPDIKNRRVTLVLDDL